MDLWDSLTSKTEEFIRSDSPFVKTFHAINLRAMNELDSSSCQIVKEINEGVTAMNFHIGILRSPSEDDELKDVAHAAIADIIIQKPMVVRWLVTELIKEGEIEKAEILMLMTKEFVEAALDAQGMKQYDFWAKLEEVYNEQQALNIDLLLHLKIKKYSKEIG